MAWQHVGVCFLLVGLFTHLPIDAGQSNNGVNYVTTASDRLMQDIMSGYTKALPYNGSGPVSVGLNFALFQILELDGQKQVLTVTGSLSMGWSDMHFTWDESYYGGLTITSLPASAVWTPTLGIKNSAAQEWDLRSLSLLPVKIMHNGFVVWTVKSQFSVSCSLDMRKFPFDTQKCSIQVSPIIHTKDVLDLMTLQKKVILDGLVPSNEYDLVKTSVQRSEGASRDYPDVVYAYVSYTMTLRRKPLFYVLTLLVPSLVQTMLTVLVFMVPMEAGEKISFSISILLSFSVFLIVLSEQVPPASDQMPILGVFYAAVIIIAGLALSCTVLIVHINHVERPMPGWLHKMVVVVLGDLVGMRDQTLQPLKRPEQVGTASTSAEPTEDNVEMNDVDEHNDEMGKPGHAVVSSIASDVHQILAALEAGEKTEVMRKPWKLAARILDRFFLIIYLVVILTTTLTMLVTYLLIDD